MISIIVNYSISCLIAFINFLQTLWTSPIHAGSEAKKAEIRKLVWRMEDKHYVSLENKFVSIHVRYALPGTILELGNIPADVNWKTGLVTIFGIPLPAMARIYNSEIYPFFRLAIFQEFETITRLSINDLLDFAESIPYPKDISVTFLWSVGRCGSTLLGSLLADLSGWYTIGEGDDIYQAAELYERFGVNIVERTTRALLKLHLIQITKTHPDCRMVVMKPRPKVFGSIAYLTDIPGGPTVHHMFLYRNLIPSSKSFYACLKELVDIHLDSMLSKVIGGRKIMENFAAPLFFQANHLAKMLDEEKKTTVWTTRIQHWQKMRSRSNQYVRTYFLYDRQPVKQFIYRILIELDKPKDLFAIKYELFLNDPLQYLHRIVAKISDKILSDEEIASVKERLKKDSQANSDLSRESLKKIRTACDISTAEFEAELRRVLLCFEQEDDLDPQFLLPNTLQ